MTRAVATRVAVAVMVLAPGVAGCSASSGPGDEPATLAAELCAAAATAVDEPQTAVERFSVDLHGPLHDLTDELVEEDRAAARQVLDAKFAVESLAREDEPRGADLHDALEQLAEQIPGSSGCQQ